MMGRYYYYRIHPFTLPELLNRTTTKLKPIECAQLLFQFGGFPEPLLKQDEVELRRWHLQRLSKLVRVDLRDLENISDLDKVKLLADALPSRVGSLLSYKSLAEDLSINDKTVKRWISILDMLYYCFQIAPYGAPKIRAVKKAPKLYLWDWSRIEDHGFRFENMVASHLLKWCDYNQDVLGYKTELRFVRDELGRACDFVVLQNKKPLFAVECKYSDDNTSDSLMKLRPKFKDTIPKWYQVRMDTIENNINSKVIAPDFKILPFSRFCEELKLV
jgi:predicted AAA+ superfamily ATPase